jgi:hypothetical protein
MSARLAATLRWAENDGQAVVSADNSLLSISVVDPGPRTVRLPRPVTVKDGFTGEILARELHRFVADFDERESSLFIYEKGATSPVLQNSPRQLTILVTNRQHSTHRGKQDERR